MNVAEQVEHLKEATRVAGIEPTRVVLPAERQVIANNVRLHLLDWGEPDAPPIVLLHGGSLTAHTWDLVALSLCDRYRCVAIDMRGHGDSEWAPDVDYRFETIAKDVRCLMRQLSLTAPVLIGMSYGGLVAIRLAGDHSADLSGLVIVDTGPDMHIGAARKILEFTQQDRERDSIEDFVDRSMRFNRRRRPELLRRSLVHNLRVLPNGRWTWKWDWRRMDNVDLETLRLQIAALWESVEHISAPTLIVRGEHSRVFHRQDAKKLAEGIERALVVEVKGAGHAVQGDNPKGLIDELEPFLRERFTHWPP